MTNTPKNTKRDSQFMREFARRLEACRIAAGYANAAEFARKLGISDYTYRHYERGTAAPDLETLVEISRLLDKTLDFLVLGIGKPSRN